VNHSPLLHRGMRARLPYRIADLGFVILMRGDLRFENADARAPALSFLVKFGQMLRGEQG
jgi:hypothetical protein